MGDAHVRPNNPASARSRTTYTGDGYPYTYDANNPGDDYTDFTVGGSTAAETEQECDMCCYMSSACSSRRRRTRTGMSAWMNDACVTDCRYNPFTYDPNDPYNPGDGTITLPYTYDPTHTYDPDTFVRPRRRRRRRRRRRCATAPTAAPLRGRRRLRQRRRLPAGAQLRREQLRGRAVRRQRRLPLPAQRGRPLRRAAAVRPAADGDSAAESRSTTMC